MPRLYLNTVILAGLALMFCHFTAIRRRRESRRYPESGQVGSSARDRLFRTEERRLILEEQRNVELAGIRMAVVELCGHMQQMKDLLQSRE